MRHIRSIHFPKLRQHHAHLKYRDDFKVTWLFPQCLNKPFISFKATQLKCFLPYRARISVIKLAWVKEILRKNQWRASLVRWVYLRSVILFFHLTHFPIPSNAEEANICEIWVQFCCKLAVYSLPLHTQRWIYMQLAMHLWSANILRKDTDKNKMSVNRVFSNNPLKMILSVFIRHQILPIRSYNSYYWK